MKFPHHLLISGSVSGESQDDDGSYTPGGSQEDPIYDDGCDAQEISSRGFEFHSGDTSLQTRTADLAVYLKDEKKIHDLQVDMQGTLTRGDRVDTVKVIKTRVLDEMIEVNIVE